MRKPFSVVLILLLSFSFVLAAASQFTPVKAAQNVNGVINTDTTWTKANSPYNLTAPVEVAQGTTLTIEQGVTVNLNTFDLIINGYLVASGTSNAPISISGGNFRIGVSDDIINGLTDSITELRNVIAEGIALIEA